MRATKVELPRPGNSWGFEYSVWRLAKALRMSDSWCKDHDILLRQCIRATKKSEIGLPTGSGKSLVFQVCAAFSHGLTLVIVPTVALGLDQIRAFREFPISKSVPAELYSSGADAERVIEQVRSKTCRVLFSSPETC